MISEKENVLRVLRHEGSAWLPCMSDSIQIIPVSPAVDNCVNGRDWFGVKWTDAVPDLRNYLLEEFAAWEKRVVFPDLDAIDWEAAAKADCAGADRDNKVIMTVTPITLLERVNSFAGVSQTMMGFYTEPDELKALLHAIADFRIKQIEHIVKYYNPDLMMLHDDYGSQKALFMSPATWREFIAPELKRLVDCVHANGKFFCLHCCGKIDDIVGDLVDMGVDMWDSVQSCCDYRKIFENYGDKLAFMPTFDLQLLDKPNPELALEELRYIIEMLGGKGLLLPRDNASLLNQDNKKVLIEEIRRIGREAYLKSCKE